MPSTPSNFFSSFRGIWPVVQRELRVGGHSAFNYWLRVATAAVGLFIFYVKTEKSMPPSAIGTAIFLSLHALVVFLLLFTIPAMMADCIAKEKREGTLGLLFMTPLSAEGIVIGKCLVQSLRAWCLWLSIVPILAVPFLLGGITWMNIAIAVVIELCVAFLALSAGLLIGSLTQNRIFAIILAELTAIILALAFFNTFSIIFGSQFTPVRYANFIPLYIKALDDFLVELPGRVSSVVVLWALAKGLVVIWFFAFLSIRLAAWHIKQSWRDKTPTRRQVWWGKRFCTELHQEAFHKKMQQTLDWNPIAFLQQYSWKNRLSKWGLCLLFVVVQCSLTNQLINFEVMQEIQTGLFLILMTMFTFIGVSSFLAEKQNGALELILITPLSVSQIIFGRSWGLWRQFLPTLLSLLLFQGAAIWVSWFRLANWSGRDLWEILIPDVVAIMGFLSLPFFATYAALRVRYLLGAALLTWIGIFLGIAFGVTMASVLSNGNMYNRDPGLLIFCFGISYTGFIGLTFFLLHHSLSRRIYSFA